MGDKENLALIIGGGVGPMAGVLELSSSLVYGG